MSPFDDEHILALTESAQACEGLLKELLAIVAEHQPERIEALRNEAAGFLQRMRDGRPPIENAQAHVGMMLARHDLLDAALVSVGRPQTMAEVIPLPRAPRDG